MVIDRIQDDDDKEQQLALLKILALEKNDALAGKGLSAEDFLKELDAMDAPYKVTQEDAEAMQAAIPPNTPASAAAVFDLLATLPADFMAEGRDDRPPQTRESF